MISPALSQKKTKHKPTKNQIKQQISKKKTKTKKLTKHGTCPGVWLISTPCNQCHGTNMNVLIIHISSSVFKLSIVKCIAEEQEAQ